MGEILAGILIGPSVLGWIVPSEFTATMAGLGVMFLLFRVGLEVDATELMKTGVHCGDFPSVRTRYWVIVSGI